MAQRGLWSGSISFGLLNIPVEVMSSKEQEHIHFHMLDKRDQSPIGYKQYNKKTGKEIQRKDIVKAYEYKKNQYVIIDDKDFERANPKASQTIDIQDFIELEDLDFMLFEKPYYLVPKKTGEKGYVLLRKVLEETKKVAIATFVMRQSEHLVAIIAREPYLILEELRFAHEVQDVKKAHVMETSKLTKVKISPKELQMAKELVAGMTSKWNPSAYKDTYQNDLMKVIQQKVKHGKIAEVEAPEEDVKPNTNVVDLMPLLRKSLAGKSHGAKKSTRKRHEANA